MITEVLLAGVILLALCVFLKNAHTPSNIPPGPLGLPLIGSAFSKGLSMEQYWVKLQRTYGDIISTKLGSRLVIRLMRYDLIKEAFTSPHIAARPDLFTLQRFTRFTNTGLLFSSGQPWVNGRRFALTHLKDLGMGRSVMEDNIQEEARALVKDFEDKIGQPMEVTNIVNVAILNVIWKLVAGERFDVSDKAIQKLTENVAENFTLIVGPMKMLDWFPWLKNLPKSVKGYFFETDRAQKSLDEIFEFLEEVIKKHRDTFDPTNIRDYIDHYLVEMNAQKNDPESTFRTDLLDLKVSMLDMYNAGSETTSSTIRWLILYMAVYPQVQEKVQIELDQVVPTHRLPELQDKMPYFDAVIAEVSRMISLTPFSVPHMCTQDTIVSGYSIPKGAIVTAYQKGVHYDPKLWGDPEVFRPERFIDANGNFSSKEFLIPFGIGRRQCMGESVARMELKLIGAALMQQFRFSAPEGVTLNTLHDEPDYKEGSINFAKPYKVVVTKRI